MRKPLRIFVLAVKISYKLLGRAFYLYILAEEGAGVSVGNVCYAGANEDEFSVGSLVQHLLDDELLEVFEAMSRKEIKGSNWSWVNRDSLVVVDHSKLLEDSDGDSSIHLHLDSSRLTFL